MSFHGGLLGVCVAVYIYAVRHGYSFWKIADFLAPITPLGLGLGRIGNIINGELWGRVTDVPWAVIFPHADGLPRHPSPVYEAVLEGLGLFILVWCYARKARPYGCVTGVFLMGYGVIRFFLEFFREPDVQLGYLAFDWLTMGQLLSLPMFLIGLYMWWSRRCRPI